MLDVEQDGAGHRIERVDIEHVGEIDIGLMAKRGHAGEADLVLGASGDNRAEHRRRLRNHRQVARQNRLGGEAGVEFEARRDQAVAIGPEQADAALARNDAHLLEQRIRTGMGIVGHDNGRWDGQVRRFVQNRRYIFLGRHYDDQVWRRGQVAKRSEAGAAVDFGIAWIDQMNGAGKTRLHNIL